MIIRAAHRCQRSRFDGSGFRVQGSGFRVQGPGFRVQGSGCRVQGAGCRVQGSGFRVRLTLSPLGFRTRSHSNAASAGLNQCVAFSVGG